MHRTTPGARERGALLDPRRARRAEIVRLEALGVELSEIDPGRSEALLERFVRAFIDPPRVGRFLEEMKGRGLGDLASWMRQDCTRPARGRGSLAWLGPSGPGARCLRFEKHAALRALEITVATLEDAWATSWPGVFVNFEGGRALVVTLDYEVLRADLGMRRTSPYR